MREEFEKETKIIELSEIERQNELLNSLQAVKKSLTNDYKNLEYAEDEMIDYYIYKIKADEAHYAYLLKKLK